MTCRQCQSPNPDSESYCVKCGAVLGSDASPPALPPPMPDSLAYTRIGPAPDQQPAPERRKPAMGCLGILALIATKAKYLLGATKYKALLAFGKTGLSMFISLWFWAMLYPLWFAVGFVVLILIHEIGHVLVFRAQGMKVTAPIFIPFMGAVIGMREMPKNAVAEAMAAFGGPVLGSVGALACFGIYHATANPAFLALSQVGFMINLFNLAPFSPLDGGRIVGAISPRIWLVALPVMVVAGLKMHSIILLFIVIMGLPRAIAAWRTKPEESAYYEVPARTRLAIGLAYVVLAAGLAYLMWISQSMLTDADPRVRSGVVGQESKAPHSGFFP